MADLEELVGLLSDEFGRRRVPYAFGGALALAYWAPPRATLDIDVNLFVLEEETAPAFDAIEAAGFSINRASALKSARDRGDFRAWAGPIRLDLFISFAAFHDSVASRTVARPWKGDRQIRVLAAEDLMLFKLLFDRPKDWIDIEKMAIQQAGLLELGYVRRWLGELLPVGDPRAGRLERILIASQSDVRPEPA